MLERQKWVPIEVTNQMSQRQVLDMIDLLLIMANEDTINCFDWHYN